MIFAKGLQDDGDDCHDGFDSAELESCLENTLQFRVRHPNKQGHHEGGGGGGGGGRTSESICTSD